MEIEVKSLIAAALHEDLGREGDLTSALLLPAPRSGKGTLFAKQGGVVAGLDIAARVFEAVDPEIEFVKKSADGARVESGQAIADVAGGIAGILTAERTALNFLQRLSGIATLTAAYVQAVRGTKAKILDTRKTTPGLRQLEKYAVRVAGGQNHRMGLYDMILIKENHIEAAGGLSAAVSKIRTGLAARNLQRKIEVETRTLEQVQEALESEVDRIMLDNMKPEAIRAAVKRVAGRAELEASGGVTLQNVREIAETGVDFISVGALTHSAPALDLTLLITQG